MAPVCDASGGGLAGAVADTVALLELAEVELDFELVNVADEDANEEPDFEDEDFGVWVPMLNCLKDPGASVSLMPVRYLGKAIGVVKPAYV